MDLLCKYYSIKFLLKLILSLVSRLNIKKAKITFVMQIRRRLGCHYLKKKFKKFPKKVLFFAFVSKRSEKRIATFNCEKCPNTKLHLHLRTLLKVFLTTFYNAWKQLDKFNVNWIIFQNFSAKNYLKVTTQAKPVHF